MKNLDAYIAGMTAAMKDKLWFKERMSEIFNDAYVYDLGCADGALIRQLAPEFPNSLFIGLDISDDMLTLARERQGFSNERYDKIDTCNVKVYTSASNRPKVLILSSVMHEIFTYSIDPCEYLHDVIQAIKPDYILFRDMLLDERTMNLPVAPEDVDCIYKRLMTWTRQRWDMALEFEDLWGKLSEKNVNLLHYLFKYRFINNWDREVQENYFPISLETLLEIFKEFGYVPSHMERYTHEYTRRKVREDFEVDIQDLTHANIVFKRMF